MSKLPSLNDKLTGNFPPQQQQNQQPQQPQQQNNQGFGPVYIPEVNKQQQQNQQPYFPNQNNPQPQPFYPQPQPFYPQQQNNVNSHFTMARNNGGNYAFPGEEINYVHSGNDGNYYMAIARSFKCPHFDNPKFFKQEQLPNSYSGNSMTLIAVSWLDVFMNFNHVLAGNYQLVINQSFAPNNNVKNRLEVSVEINDQKISTIPNWPSDDIVKNATGALKETYICNISRDQFSKLRPLNANQEYKVTVKVSNTKGDWKNGWTIDGARLIAM